MKIIDILNLLESNNYVTTPKNVYSLLEGLSSGEYKILSTKDVILTEGMAEDYVYMQILDKNNLEVDAENVNILKECIDNGYVLLSETKTQEDITQEELDEKEERRKKRKKLGKKVLNAVKNIGIAGAIGAGLGSGASGIKKLATGDASIGPLSTGAMAGAGAGAVGLIGAAKTMHDNKKIDDKETVATLAKIKDIKSAIDKLEDKKKNKPTEFTTEDQDNLDINI